ncbi:MAG: hypothetical protein FWB91_08550 [Defluviitaleaceae bacterium]|nr:hypothetical protein [Defluviitaleaceae bacterium]
MRIYADVTTKGVTVYEPRRGGVWETTVVPLPPGIFDVADIKAELNLPRFKASSVVAVANLRKTIIRVANISPVKKAKVLTQDAKWELVRSAFPIGDKMNENTHIFDGGEFVNEKSEARFFMAALPKEISEIIARVGEALVGSVHRLARIDTVEYILLKRYAGEAGVLILLPQDEGLRLLAVAEGLPLSFHYISNHPGHREGELLRYLQSIEKFVMTRAVCLYGEFEHISKWQWMHSLLRELPIEEKPFCLL